VRLSTLSIAWRNLGRNRRRTALALTAIALGQIVVIAINGMMAGMFDSMLKTITGPLIGHVQVHHKDWREDRAVELYIDKLSDTRTAIESLPGVKSISPRLFTAVLAAPGEQAEKPADAEAAIVVGVDVDVESHDKGLLETLAPNERPGSRNVVIGTVLARRLGIKPGHLVAMIGQDSDEFPVSDLFTVSAVIKSSSFPKLFTRLLPFFPRSLVFIFYLSFIFLRTVLSWNSVFQKSLSREYIFQSLSILISSGDNVEMSANFLTSTKRFHGQPTSIIR
jgi:ABC-type lipoprotein release transport system permease subunit